MNGRLRVLELFCGLGGVRAVLDGAVETVGAVDVSTVALDVYRANFPAPAPLPRLLEGLDAAALAAFGADLWTLSPPCQPYTRRGKGRDLDDPRAASLLHLLEVLRRVRPSYVFVENVPEFVGSRAHQRLRRVLEEGEPAYRLRQHVLCPSELGWPNRRRRFYLLAARQDAPPLRAPLPAEPSPRRALAAFVDPRHDDDPDLTLPPQVVQSYRGALDVVHRDDPDARTACFTAAYGRSHVRSGSYLALDRAGERLRRFHPREVLALLGFPPDYALPPQLPLGIGWRLAGNSLSLPAVRRVLAAVPGVGPAAS